MKEIFSAFGSEVFRPLVTLMLPGAIGVSTHFIWVVQKYDSVKAQATGNRTEAIVILSAIALFLGLLFEDIGSRIEASIDEARNKQPGSNHIANWDNYLRMAFRIEPVGQRYLHTIVLRLKFELGSSIAVVVALPGLWLTSIPLTSAIWITVVLASTAIYLAYEAWSSTETLSWIRARLIEGITEVPSPPPQTREVLLATPGFVSFQRTHRVLKMKLGPRRAGVRRCARATLTISRAA